MAYKLLPKMRGTASTSPAVHISKGAISFNKAARAAFGVDEFSHAHIHQDDEDAGKMAIEMLNGETKDSNLMRNGAIAGGSWIRHYKLPTGAFAVDKGADGLMEFRAVATTGKAAKNDNAEEKPVKQSKKAA